MAPGVRIQKAKQVAPRRGIDDLVNAEFAVGLGTTTGLASHSGWMTSRMKPASSIFRTELQMKSCLSEA